MLSYGHPNRSILPYTIEKNYLDSLIPELNNYPFPDYNSQEVVDEINTLIKFTDSVSNNEEAQKRLKLYDEGFEQYIVKVLGNLGIDIKQLMKDIHDDITPLIVKLKYSYQRIRPNQLAYMLQMRLYPYKSNFSDTPSYPSGHTIQSKVYCEVLSNKYPQYHHQLISLADDIANSRLYMGVHYPSDNKFGQYVSDLILNHPEFKTKYLK